ncbi:hypothetical protein IEQ34_020588 [Dendrobium chrysotoxum]|uniref:Uncharacterized protein n=1 Tax=Dendrobium chrysotoxum TaxID=161865 RepID=A0AAV7G0K5_DENCH|nr:hypothetical protein IEQ34_020588 [Dendrobium chrysotoxum]
MLYMVGRGLQLICDCYDGCRWESLDYHKHDSGSSEVQINDEDPNVYETFGEMIKEDVVGMQSPQTYRKYT